MCVCFKKKKKKREGITLYHILHLNLPHELSKCTIDFPNWKLCNTWSPFFFFFFWLLTKFSIKRPIYPSTICFGERSKLIFQYLILSYLIFKNMVGSTLKQSYNFGDQSCISIVHGSKYKMMYSLDFRVKKCNFHTQRKMKKRKTEIFVVEGNTDFRIKFNALLTRKEQLWHHEPIKLKQSNENRSLYQNEKKPKHIGLFGLRGKEE